jgi:hypothetical protein
MKNIITYLLPLTFLLTSCVAINTRESTYPKMYSEHPTTILVMPPINNTTNVDAKELLYTSISYPLIEAGYYVISPHLAMEMLKAESAYDAELFIDQNAGVFARVFGADAVIFSVIDKWQKVGSGIQTDIHYIVKSTATNEVLFERQCNLFLDLRVESGNSGLLGTLIDITATAITTALTDHITAARLCNSYIFRDLPRGKYSPEYQQDQGRAAEQPNAHVTIRR